MYICAPHMFLVQRSEEGVRSPGTAVTDGCVLPHGCWGLNWGPLKEQLSVLKQSHLSSPTSFACGFCESKLDPHVCGEAALSPEAAPQPWVAVFQSEHGCVISKHVDQWLSSKGVRLLKSTLRCSLAHIPICRACARQWCAVGGSSCSVAPLQTPHGKFSSDCERWRRNLGVCWENGGCV